MFLDQKHEKDCKIKELLILKEENPPGELKEMKIKIENLKASQAKEYNGRKEKEQKLEQAHLEVQKKTTIIEDLYNQIDQLYEQSSSQDEKLQKCQKEMQKLQTDLQAQEAKNIQISLDFTKVEADLANKNQELFELKNKFSD